MSAQSVSETQQSFVQGFISFIIIFVIVLALWHVFMDANGILKFYTPMLGFSLVAVWLGSILLISNIFEWSPFREEKMSSSGGLGLGLLLTALSIIFMLIIVYGIFWNFIGRFGVAYFSPASIVASGGHRRRTFRSKGECFNSHYLHCDGVYLVDTCLGFRIWSLAVVGHE